jgi:hypothetical protein
MTHSCHQRKITLGGFKQVRKMLLKTIAQGTDIELHLLTEKAGEILDMG